MRYLLVIGFACDVYRKLPLARIFVDNRFIDEFEIPVHKDTLESNNQKFKEKHHILEPIEPIKIFEFQKKSFPPLRFLEIDIDNRQDQIELRMEIENSDSNYMNGFMTATTLLKLQIFYFFPLNKKLLSKLVEYRNKNFANKNYAWYVCNKNIIFKLMDNGITYHNKDDIMSFAPRNTISNIGGNCCFSCTLVKKYGIYMTKLLRSYRYNLFQTPVIDYFFNKYLENADQRNNN